MNSGCDPFGVGSPLFIHSRGCDPFGVRHAVQFPIAAFDPERVTAYCIISTKEVFDPEGVGAGVRVRDSSGKPAVRGAPAQGRDSRTRTCSG